LPIGLRAIDGERQMANRLTNEIRERVALAVLRHRFAGDVSALVRDRAAFAEDVYSDIYRKADRERMEALPEGWLPTSVAVTAKFGEHSSGYETIQFDGSIRSGTLCRFHNRPSSRSLGIWRRIPNKHQHGCSKVYDPSHKLAKRQEELRVRQTTLEQLVLESQKQIEAALNSVTTASALVKAWPEMEPFVKQYMTASPNLPSIPASKLNEIFKLPVSEAA
jgi:hypothetical protein